MGTVRLFNHPIKILYLFLVFAEAALLAASAYLGVYLRHLNDPDAMPAIIGTSGPRALLFVLVMMLSLVAVGLYNRRLRDGMDGILVRLFLGFLLGALALFVIFHFFSESSLDRGAFFLSLACAFVLMVFTRFVFLQLLAQRHIRRRVLVLGAGKRAYPLSMLRRRSDLIGFSIIGYVPAKGDSILVSESQLLRSEQPLHEIAARERIEQIVVAVDDRRQGLPMDELLRCRTQGVEVVDVLSFLEQETGQIKIDLLYPSWLAFSRGFHRSVPHGVAKRAFDIAVSMAMLVTTLPLMGATALAILLESGMRGPVLYRQKRVGEGGRVFDVYKFRSMRVDAEKDGQARWAQANDPRVTRVGAFIRKYRIDELPQIFNVLRGDMSFVGPRPERPEFVQGLQQKLPYYVERHRVKPGLTGWAQICYPYGASDTDAFEKLQYDLYYVKNHSLFLDMTILLQTAEVVLWGKGAR